MKQKVFTMVCSIIALYWLAVLTVIPTAAEAFTVTYSCPAITADIGQKVTLSSYSVEFSYGTATSAEAITWSSEKLTITNGTVTPTATGVYKLIASSSGKIRTVYLVVKNASDTEYVLYSNDFSNTDISDWRVVQQSSGATVNVSDGKLILDASGNSSYYIRILLPEWLGAFGDCRITATLTMEKAASSTNWLSLMARVQSNNTPYWQACLRQKATASNGTEIAERTVADKWNVTHTAAYSESISGSKLYQFSFELQGTTATTSIDGQSLLHSSVMTNHSGRMGIQTRGAKVLIDSVKVTVPTSAIEIPSANVHTVREQKSNLALTPVMASFVRTSDDLNSIQKTSPAVAVLYVNADLKVTREDASVLCPLGDALSKLGETVIPAFYIKDSATVSPLCEALKKSGLGDVMFISADSGILNSARIAFPDSQAILDCTGASISSDTDLLALRAKANRCRARVILLSAKSATRDNVEYLQRRFMTVWTTAATETQAAYLAAITSGANGIVLSDRAAYEVMLTKYFEKNTLTRQVNVIGHRGVPSLSQENTVAGSVLAFNKGATMIENDIYLTRDNVIVVMHDSTLDRTTNGSGKVENFTYEQLQKFSVNVNQSPPSEPIPSREDYFKEFKGKDVQLVIEIKKDANTAIVSALAELIEKYDIADQVNVITFSESFVNSMRQQLPEISVGYLTSSIAMSESAADQTLRDIMNIVCPLATTYNPSYASGALGYNTLRLTSYRGLTVWPWTVNKQADFDKYLLLGTNGITTNYSQWVTNYTRRIDAPASEITVGSDGVDFKIIKQTYGRATSQITNAQLVVVDDGGANVTYSDGKLSATGNGTATVYFKLNCLTASGSTYYLCTEPVRVTAAASTTSPDSDTTSAEPQSPASPGTSTAVPQSSTSPADADSTTTWQGSAGSQSNAHENSYDKIAPVIIIIITVSVIVCSAIAVVIIKKSKR
ncbi:MAG: glycerophosphodiester phosphodiesterase family protein [Eubacteriales bacterium]|nr:glycerophosphodiester phosphodiesterase family protein [Eubacteriales bacterium]